MILQTLYGIAAMEETLATLADARKQSALGRAVAESDASQCLCVPRWTAAIQHAKRFVSHIASGWPDDTLERIGIDPKTIEPVRQAYAQNRGVDYAASITPDEAVERLIIAGTPEQCGERIAELFLSRRDMGSFRCALACRRDRISRKLSIFGVKKSCHG